MQTIVNSRWTVARRRWSGHSHLFPVYDFSRDRAIHFISRFRKVEAFCRRGEFRQLSRGPYRQVFEDFSAPGPGVARCDTGAKHTRGAGYTSVQVNMYLNPTSGRRSSKRCGGKTLPSRARSTPSPDSRHKSRPDGEPPKSGRTSAGVHRLR